MKKVVTAILTILYFSVSSGMVFNIHYCKDKVSSVQIDLLAKDLCGCSKKDKKTNKKNCCKTEHKIIKLQNDHKVSTVDYSFKTPITPVLFTNYFFNTSFKSLNFNNHTTIIPPLISEQDIHIENCVFRI
ncbi:MAG: hypothetical protein LC122_06990 [Chitinophagales bacterium]|nr:hypothetical protein [Chitinophagales bacterium]